jgi:hypothetical protein
MLRCGPQDHDQLSGRWADTSPPRPPVRQTQGESAKMAEVGKKRIGCGILLGILVLLGIIGSLMERTSDKENSSSQPSPSAPTQRQSAPAEKYALGLQQAYEAEGFDVEVLYLDDEKTLTLRSDEFKDATAREAVASKLEANRKQLCSIDVWYVKVGYSKGALSRDVMKSLDLGCPAEKAARVEENRDARVKYAQNLNVDPSIQVSASGTLLVAESDEFFSKQAYRTAFARSLLSDPTVVRNLCDLGFSQIRLRSKGQTVKTVTVPCK